MRLFLNDERLMMKFVSVLVPAVLASLTATHLFAKSDDFFVPITCTSGKGTGTLTVTDDWTSPQEVIAAIQEIEAQSGCAVPTEIYDSFTKLFKIAQEHKVSYVDLLNISFEEARKKTGDTIPECDGTLRPDLGQVVYEPIVQAAPGVVVDLFDADTMVPSLGFNLGDQIIFEMPHFARVGRLYWGGGQDVTYQITARGQTFALPRSLRIRKKFAAEKFDHIATADDVVVSAFLSDALVYTAKYTIKGKRACLSELKQEN